jgi:hypothetical protein
MQMYTFKFLLKITQSINLNNLHERCILLSKERKKIGKCICGSTSFSIGCYCSTIEIVVYKEILKESLIETQYLWKLILSFI